MADFLIDEDSVVSLKDIVDEEQELQDTANAVLGDSDDTNCTYSKGYVSRQAVYSCGTCTPSDMAGICLACSLHCHEGHNLYELYTKRNFRCDCGNSKFSDNQCQLCPDKDLVNSNNMYNHNYKGLYCTCNRPYPDSEDETDDTMLQCIVCEDWYHSRHLGHVPPESYEEMICDKCMERLSFLRCYQIHFSTHCNGEDINVSTTESTTETYSNTREPHSHTTDTQEKSHSNATESHSCTTTTATTTAETHSNTLAEKSSCIVEKCKKLLPDPVPSGPGYFTGQWRTDQLCSCSSCKKLYDELSVEFLLDVNDSVKAYEERATGRGYLHETGLEALGSAMGHVQQVEMITGYNYMKEKLKMFLGEFANQGKVVRPRDITDFFGELESSKRQRLEDGVGVPPDSCHQ